MKKNLIISISILFFSSVLWGQNVKFKTTMSMLQASIEETMQKGVEDGWYGAMNIPDLLFMMITENKDAYYIFCHPLKYKKEILMYINNNSVKWEYRYIALGMLQGLCIDEYLPIIENIYNLFNVKITNPPINLTKPIRSNNFHPSLDVLKLCVDQSNLSMEVCRNYSDKSLRKLLTQIINNKKVPFEIKKNCTDIMNGNKYRQMKMSLENHWITIPLVECKNGKPCYYSYSFFQGKKRKL